MEAVDSVFQTNMLDMLKQTGIVYDRCDAGFFYFYILPVSGRAEAVVGWYHSHPGFGCWLSGVDMQTQTSFEQLNKRAVCSFLNELKKLLT